MPLITRPERVIKTAQTEYPIGTAATIYTDVAEGVKTRTNIYIFDVTWNYLEC